MTTVVAPGGDSGSGGWAVAIVILLVVIVGGFIWYTKYRGGSVAPAGTNINVTVPTPGGSAQ